MEGPEFDEKTHQLEVTADTKLTGEFETEERGRFPLALVPPPIPPGQYTVRYEKGLLDRESVVLEVSNEEIRVRIGEPR